MNSINRLAPHGFGKQSPVPTTVIVGAGPIGLTLAILLKMRGVSLRIIEKNAGPSTATKAIAIHSRTLEIFRDMGVAEQAVAEGFAINRFAVQSDGKKILEYDFSRLEAPYRMLLSLPQPQTEKILLERLESLGVSVEWNTELTGLQQHGDSVDLTLRHADGHEEQTRCRWLAACDGARSNIRKHLGLSFEGEFYDRFFMLADADIEWSGSKDEGAFFLGAKEGYVAVAPINEQSRYRLFIEMPYDLPPEGERPPLTLENFQRLCEGRGQQMTLSNLSSTTIASFQHRRVKSMQEGSVFLVGDSAHIGSPIGGQWMNLGISEAYNLAWKMAFVDQGLASAVLLQSYHAERYPVALEVENTAHRLTGLITVQRRPLVWLRDNVLPLLTRREKVQRVLPSMISGHKYAYPIGGHIQQPLTQKQRNDWQRKGHKAKYPSPLPQAGKLAPDVSLWQHPELPERHLIDLFGQRFTLLIFTAADQFSPALRGYRGLAASIEGRYHGVQAYCVVDALETGDFPADQRTLLDPDWRLHQRYHAATGTLLLVRPDGYIAFLGLEASDLDDYLRTRSGLLKAVTETTIRQPEAVPLPA
ncbi:FAD-dependent monooxygenase [Pseudomonas sp. ABC1]|uniref:FAD-dependent monooxygenase n=1 Tax=Pseudomonas sp. ABC1 TaxID=2748080 RepID=UPI0015C33EE3|nr:FAD-dependent monooxygenase [Pseudomonas sp. ABC1]QLF94927.1 FAD-dependent monooxygenase [Pseudomonas sp. ABC1]